MEWTNVGTTPLKTRPHQHISDQVLTQCTWTLSLRHIFPIITVENPSCHLFSLPLALTLPLALSPLPYIQNLFSFQQTHSLQVLITQQQHRQASTKLIGGSLLKVRCEVATSKSGQRTSSQPPSCQSTKTEWK